MGARGSLIHLLGPLTRSHSLPIPVKAVPILVNSILTKRRPVGIPPVKRPVLPPVFTPVQIPASVVVSIMQKRGSDLGIPIITELERDVVVLLVVQRIVSVAALASVRGSVSRPVIVPVNPSAMITVPGNVIPTVDQVVQIAVVMAALAVTQPVKVSVVGKTVRVLVSIVVSPVAVHRSVAMIAIPIASEWVVAPSVGSNHRVPAKQIVA